MDEGTPHHGQEGSRRERGCCKGIKSSFLGCQQQRGRALSRTCGLLAHHCHHLFFADMSNSSGSGDRDRGVASSQERLVPSSISSNVSSTCSEISTTAVFTDLSTLSSSSSSSSNSSSSGEDDTSSRIHEAGDEDSTCETRTLRDEQATPIMDPEDNHCIYSGAVMNNPGQRYFNQTQVGDYELVDNPTHGGGGQLATPHSPSTPDLLYPHTHLTSIGTPPAHLPINQNGLPVYDVEPGGGGGIGDLDLDLDRQQALYYSADLLNSNVSAACAANELLEDSLSHLGSADHLIHGGHSHFLSVNNSRPFVHGRKFFIDLKGQLGNHAYRAAAVSNRKSKKLDGCNRPRTRITN